MRRVGLVGAALVLVLAGAIVVGERWAGPSGTPAARACSDPAFETSGTTRWSDGGYVVDQDLWNNTVGSQTLHACSAGNWYVTATQPDTPSVKVYPDVSRDLRWAPVGSFSSITSRYGSRGPGTGVYEYAYDVWFNGTATPGSSEIMIWTDNHGNRLHVPQRGAFTSRGRSYTAWRAGHFIAYVADTDTTSGELDLKAFFDHAIARGWLPANAKIGRIEFGVEICSTDDRPLDFGVSDFSVSAS